ncbi:MAG: hypothetical protein WB995_10175 [Candidatus Acidiferrales bacterium]
MSGGFRLYDLAFERILEAGFSLYERGNGAPESRVLLTVRAKALQVRFQAAFRSAPLPEVGPNGLVHQLIDGAPFELAEVLQRETFLSVNS